MLGKRDSGGKSDAEGGKSGNGGKDAGKKGKGGSKGKGSPAKDAPGFKTVEELEAQMFIDMLSSKGKAEKEFQKREAVKQPLEAKGSHCEVRKHSEMGCAVVTMQSEMAREVVVKFGETKVSSSSSGRWKKTSSTENGAKEKRPEINIGDVVVQYRPHVDKTAKTEVKTDIFAAWGRQAEKASPLAAASIAEAFDKLFIEAAGFQAAPAAPAKDLVGQPLLMGVTPPPPPARPMMPPPQRQMMPGSLLDLMAVQAAQVAQAQAAQAQAQAVHQQQFGVPPQVGPAAAMAAQAAQVQQAAYARAQAAQAQAVQQAQATNHLINYGVRPGLETPPPRFSSGTNEMRADAPSFMFSPQQNGHYNERMASLFRVILKGSITSMAM